jgi:two-component system chemotaxis sensor kinase CheA
VVRFGEQRAGLIVDRLLGEFQTVIKPLGRLFAHLKGIGGSTILGSGEVALILDVPALIASAERGRTAPRRIGGSGATQDAVDLQQIQEVQHEPAALPAAAH